MINLSIGVVLVLIGLGGNWALALTIYLLTAAGLGIRASNGWQEIPANFLRGLTFPVAPVVYDIDWSALIERAKRGLKW